MVVRDRQVVNLRDKLPLPAGILNWFMTAGHPLALDSALRLRPMLIDSMESCRPTYCLRGI